jgi:hypothetical protein
MDPSYEAEITEENETVMVIGTFLVIIKSWITFGEFSE